MNNNIFFISDASYCSKTKIASIASMCPTKNIKKTKVLENITSINHAETSAVLFSIKLAIKYNFNNVVFIYDNNSVNKQLIEKLYKDKFDCIQLLWVKRDLITPVDKLARNVFDDLVYLPDNKKHTSNMIHIFSSYEDTLKIKAAMKIATIKEYTVLNTFLRDSYNLKSIHPVKLKDTKLMKFLYQMIKNEEYKKKFYKYLCKVSSKIESSQAFKHMQKNTEIYKIIEEIVNKTNVQKHLDKKTKIS